MQHLINDIFGFMKDLVLLFLFASLIPSIVSAQTPVPIVPLVPIEIDEFSLKDIPAAYFGLALEPARKQLLAGDYDDALKTLEAFPEKGADRSSSLQKATFLRG